MVWHTGKKLNGGQYTIERVLGQGGFGITYLARTTNNKNVAIKTLNDEIQSDPNFVKHHNDLIEETERLQKCVHPHIVKIYDRFVEQNLLLGLFQKNLLPCLVMEYIPGEDLSGVIRKRGALPEAEALKYIKQVGQALTIVHEQGLLHRDIKPQNIMLRNDGSVVLIDFGIARKFIQDKTSTHTQCGTPYFAPPEQALPQTKRGAYTDVYALAATLYFLLTDELPQRNNITLELRSPQTLNPEISDRVNQAIIKGMEWKPEDRPQSVESWLKMLAPKKKKKSESTKIKPGVVRSIYGRRGNNTLNIEYWIWILWLDTESWIWLLWSCVFWVFVSYVCMILPINSISNHLEVSAFIRSILLAFLAIPIAIFAPSSEMGIEECWEERPKLWSISGAVLGSILGIASIHLLYIACVDLKYDLWETSLCIFVWILACASGITLISYLISLFLGIPSTILGIGKMNLQDQFYYNELITSIILIVASLLGIGLGWLMFAYI